MLTLTRMAKIQSDLEEAYTSQVKGEASDVKFDFYK